MGADDNADLLEGLAAIAAFLRVKPRRVQHLMATAGLPTFSLSGRVLNARKSTLNAWLAEREAAARAARP